MESRVYSFTDINAVASGEESPEETPQSKARRETVQPVLRRRWRQVEEKVDALRNEHDQPE